MRTHTKVRVSTPIQGLWLRREINDRGREFDDAVVLVEVDGEWHEVCREMISGIFSHIVEPVGIERGVEENPAVKAP